MSAGGRFPFVNLAGTARGNLTADAASGRRRVTTARSPFP